MPDRNSDANPERNHKEGVAKTFLQRVIGEHTSGSDEEGGGGIGEHGAEHKFYFVEEIWLILGDMRKYRDCKRAHGNRFIDSGEILKAKIRRNPLQNFRDFNELKNAENISLYGWMYAGLFQFFQHFAEMGCYQFGRSFTAMADNPCCELRYPTVPMQKQFD
jgi:hypothetical protein